MIKVFFVLFLTMISFGSWAAEEDHTYGEMVYEINQKKMKNKSQVEKLLQTLIQEVKNNPDTPIQINIFQNAYFSNEKSKGRKMASRSPASQSKSGYSGIIDDINTDERIHFHSKIFYSRLRARDIDNGGSATSNSKQNWGLFLGYDRELNESFDIIGELQSTFQQFNAPGGYSLTNSRNIYLGASVGGRWKMDQYFNADMSIGIKQLPYLTATGIQASISRVTHPYLKAAMELKMQKYLGIDLRPQVSAEFLSSGFDGGINGATGFKFGSRLSYHFNFKKLRPNITLWYDQYNLDTRVTEQNTNEVGILLGFYLWL